VSSLAIGAGIFVIAMLAGIFSLLQKMLASIERIEKRLDDQSKN